MRCYPLRLRIVAVVLAAAVVVGTTVGWIALPAHLRAQFTAFQLATLIALLLAVLLVIGAVALSYVEADQDGMVFRNGLRTHRLTWSDVSRLSYRSGEPWASVWVLSGAGASTPRLAEPDGQPGVTEEVGAPEPHKLILLGIQRSDRARADRAVAQLRELHPATRSHAP